jgi:Ca2+-transporting ATPase
MLKRILGVGLTFFVVLVGLWQLFWHKNISSVSDLLSVDSLKVFFSGFFDPGHIKPSLDPKELGIFFSLFVMLQFWNLFNVKYFHTDRSLIMDVVDIIRKRRSDKILYSRGFIWISLVILLGQILIVTFAGPVFNVYHLTIADWGWLLLITSPVLLVADVVRTLRVLCRKRSA